MLLQANALPNTTYAAGLTYSTANYSSGTLAFALLACDGSPATIPITVQSHKRAS